MCQILSYSSLNNRIRLLMYSPWFLLSVFKWWKTNAMFCSAFIQTLKIVICCPHIDKQGRVLLGSGWYSWALCMLVHYSKK